jgi:hypothetical protein
MTVLGNLVLGQRDVNAGVNILKMECAPGLPTVAAWLSEARLGRSAIPARDS